MNFYIYRLVPFLILIVLTPTELNLNGIRGAHSFCFLLSLILMHMRTIILWQLWWITVLFYLTCHIDHWLLIQLIKHCCPHSILIIRLNWRWQDQCILCILIFSALPDCKIKEKSLTYHCHPHLAIWSYHRVLASQGTNQTKFSRFIYGEKGICQWLEY